MTWMTLEIHWAISEMYFLAGKQYNFETYYTKIMGCYVFDGDFLTKLYTVIDSLLTHHADLI